MFGKVKTLLKYWGPPLSIPQQYVNIGHCNSKSESDVLLPLRTSSSVVFNQFNQTDKFDSNVGVLCSVPQGGGKNSTQNFR
jgi:hypothetical protein